MRDYENDPRAFNDATINFFYDDYFKGEEGHNYTDEQIAMSANAEDIEDCLTIMRGILRRHFGITSRRKQLVRKEELIRRADRVWSSPTYDDLLDLVTDLTKYIEKGE